MYSIGVGGRAHGTYVLYASAIQFYGNGWWGSRVPAALCSLQRRFMYRYQRGGRASAGAFFICGSTLIFPGVGKGGKDAASGSLLSAAVLLVCMSAGREGERAGLFFALLPAQAESS